MKSVVCQAHLSPLPLHVSPVYWSYDNALRIYPLPDLIVFGDKYDPYTVTTAGCIGTNTVSFVLLFDNLFAISSAVQLLLQ